MLLSIPITAQHLTLGEIPAQENRQYSQDKPLVYVDAWDLWPYVFLNEHGEPDGYNIDLFRKLMKELDIPYIIKLKPRRRALDDLKEGRADLTMGMDAHFHNSYGRYGKSVLNLFTHSVLSPKSQPIVIRSLQDLAKQQVIVHERSYSHDLMIQKGWEHNAIPVKDVKEAAQEVSTNEQGYILWNTVSLKWIKRMMHLDNLQLIPVDMPHGEYKFMSNDPQLLSLLDEAYIKVRTRGDLEPMQKKWFHPEDTETGIPSWVWHIANFIVVVAFSLIFYYVNYRIREHYARKLARQRTGRLSQILQTCHVRISIFDVASQNFTVIGQDGHSTKTYTSLELAHLYFRDDFDRLYAGIQQVIDMQQQSLTLEMTGYESDTNRNERQFRMVLSPLRYEQGKPSAIICTRCDITEENEKRRRAKEQLMRYRSMFNTVMVDMAFYDKNGYVVDMNERTQHTFNISLEEAKKQGFNIKNLVGKDFDLDNFEYFHATQFLTSNDINGDSSHDGIVYYEHQLVPVRDKESRLLGIYGSGRVINETVQTYHQASDSIRKLQKATNEVTDYVKNINYVLGVGGVRIVNYSPDAHTLTIFKGLNIVQLTLTQTRCMAFVDEKSKKTALRILNSMDSRKDQVLDAEIKTTLHHSGMLLYLQFHLIPTYDPQGKVQNYFGLCRDISDIISTNIQLEQQTLRAQEVETLKNSFLRNMSHEIRTPLSAVVGFSELFEQEHDVADEPFFIKEIKDNSAHLLHLINDILFLSRLDAHMIDIEKSPVDFAQTFESYCHLGWANYQKEGVKYKVMNLYSQLVVNIDDTNMGRIIEQVVANAAQHTTKGAVQARYDYIGDKLVITVEDTGSGISKDDLQHVYERFSTDGISGTGLGLPICKELARQMGGTIDISSEVGKGTTVWITMPCTAIAKERRKDL